MFANRSESSACKEPVVVIAPRPPSRARTTPLVSLPAMSSPRKTAHERLNTALPRKKRKRRATLHAKRPSEPVTTPRHLPRRDTYPLPVASTQRRVFSGRHPNPSRTLLATPPPDCD